MSKNSIADYSTTASSNTDIEGINIDEGCAPSGMNNALRELMAHIATYRDSRVIGTNIQAFNANLASLSGLTLSSDRLLYATGANTFALTGLSPYARTLIAALNSTSARNILDLPTRTAAQITNTGDANHENIGVFAGDELRSAILSLIGGLAIGEGQSWQDVTGSRSAGASYQNTTGKPIQVAIRLNVGPAGAVQVSSDNSNWVTIGVSNTDAFANVSFIVPNNHYYRLTGVTAGTWSELR